MKVLIVEDNEILSNNISTYLQLENIENRSVKQVLLHRLCASFSALDDNDAKILLINSSSVFDPIKKNFK